LSHVQHEASRLFYLKEERLEEEMRRCNRCEIEKPLDEFAKNITRKSGRDFTCKECRRKERALRGRIPKPFSDSKRSGGTAPRRPMMADEVFRKYYYNRDLRAFINWYSKTRSSNKERQEDLRQIAWAEISMCKPDQTDEYYKQVAKRAIYREYQRDYKMRKYELEFIESMDAIEYLKWQFGVRE